MPKYVEIPHKPYELVGLVDCPCAVCEHIRKNPGTRNLPENVEPKDGKWVEVVPNA